MEYKYYGSEAKLVHPINKEYQYIKDQRHMYELMQHVWDRNSCAPRMREMWSEKNNTVGQCSITSFLIQDIFGGEVYGVPLKEGGYHCFNKVGDSIFDLTSEQFGDEKLDYTLNYPQSREVQFSNEDKYNRYLYIKEKLEKLIK